MPLEPPPVSDPVPPVTEPVEVVGPIDPMEPGALTETTPPPATNYIEVSVIAPCNPDGGLQISDSEIPEVLAGRWHIEARRRGFSPPDNPNVILLPGYVWLVPSFGGRILPIDGDGDGVPDFRDACGNTPAGTLINADGCSIEQLCPCAGPWKNHGEYVKCMRQVTASFLDKGLISPPAAQALMRNAANSNCGGPELAIFQKRTH